MARERIVTHAYRLDGGWHRVRRARLTSQYADELRTQGYTMVKARRGLFNTREISLQWQPRSN